VVRLIFDLYLKGYSILGILSELRAQQIKSPTGHDTWSKRTIETILRNEKDKGDVLIMKTYTEAYPDNKRKVNQGERAQYLAMGAHPAIISKEEFDNVTAMREARSNLVRGDDGNTRKPTRYSMKKAKKETESQGTDA
jgi:site-specific DNA recombinase